MSETLFSPPVKKPRAKSRKLEHGFSHWVDHFFDRVILEPGWWTAIDHSGESIGRDPQKQMRWREAQKAMGIKPSHLDWYAVQFDAVAPHRPTAIVWIELKVGSNDATDGQGVTIRLLQERGQVADVAYTIPACLALLRRAGFRLHANADNIAAEVQARVEAARQAPSKKRRASRAAKPRYTGIGITSSMLVGRGR